MPGRVNTSFVRNHSADIVAHTTTSQRHHSPAMPDSTAPHAAVPPAPPPSSSRPWPQRVPVLIAGGGPVGLTLAALLARQGIASLVVEADDGYCAGSRAICMARRSLESSAGWARTAPPPNRPAWVGGRSYYRDARCCISACQASPASALRRWSISSSTTWRPSPTTPRCAAPRQRMCASARACRQCASTAAASWPRSRPAKAWCGSTRNGWWPATAGAAPCASNWACAWKAPSTKAAT